MTLSYKWYEEFLRNSFNTVVTLCLNIYKEYIYIKNNRESTTTKNHEQSPKIQSQILTAFGYRESCLGDVKTCLSLLPPTDNWPSQP